ncbi:MAG: hypothetical protein IH851_13960 [Armatimonadetes bacterium]|nr:hypothetical protein [Armatimonadota bacterium]
MGTQSPYPRPQPQGVPFAADKVIGIIIMVLAACGVILGIMLTAGGGLFSEAFEQAAAQEGATAEEAAVAGMMGIGVALAGVLIIVMSGVSIAIGWGVMKSARWAFILGAVWYGIGALLNLVTLNPVVVIPAALVVYCILRLNGTWGPKPA